MKNLNWFFSELIKLLSNEKSYFSKKRFESFCFFILVLLSFIIFMAVNMATIEALEFLEVTGALMIYSGYTVRQIQKEKNNEIKN